MSYEYYLRFKNKQEANQAFSNLGQQKLVIDRANDRIKFKDSTVHSWSYDVVVAYDGSDTLFLEIAMPSKEVYSCIDSSLTGMQYSCVEEGFEGEELSLKNAFRIKTE